MKKMKKICFVIAFVLAISCNNSKNIINDENDVHGELVVCFASYSPFELNYTPEEMAKGLSVQRELLHRYGIPVTCYLYASVVKEQKDLLKQWHDEFGDEVGLLNQRSPIETGLPEFKQLQEVVTWQTIRSAANINYGPDWVYLYQQIGIESVWGRAYEQSATDGISDRGCPHGFYYLNPVCSKVPNPKNGGVLSVPWLSQDLNMVFRTAHQPTFTFDVNDIQDVRVNDPNDDSFWVAELNEFKKQTKYNKVVPLVIQQEVEEFMLDEPGFGQRRPNGYAVLESLLKVLQREEIKVVTVSEAVDKYKKAYPDKTPPTYAINDNIGQLPIIKNNNCFYVSDQRFTTGNGPTYNGYYPTNYDCRGKAPSIDYPTNNFCPYLYYHPQGIPYNEQGKLFTYYDVNGLLMFEEGNPYPIRITPYVGLTGELIGETILPEMSYWFDTDKYIPRAEIQKSETEKGFSLKIKAGTHKNKVFTSTYMPYGVMLWGDYSKFEIPGNAPVGAKILNTEGLFIPMMLKEGINELNLEIVKIK
jgi:hypothetical protein